MIALEFEKYHIKSSNYPFSAKYDISLFLLPDRS